MLILYIFRQRQTYAVSLSIKNVTQASSTNNHIYWRFVTFVVCLSSWFRDLSYLGYGHNYSLDFPDDQNRTQLRHMQPDSAENCLFRFSYIFLLGFLPQISLLVLCLILTVKYVIQSAVKSCKKMHNAYVMTLEEDGNVIVKLSF